LLLALFSFTLMVPWLPADSEAKLPPCCRRDGKHGCGMKMKSAPASTGVALREASRCSMFGKGSATPAADRVFVIPQSQMVATVLTSHPASVEQAETSYRISFSRAWQKRGPPSLLS